MDTHQPFPPADPKGADKAADTAQETLDATRDALRHGLSEASTKVDSARNAVKTAAAIASASLGAAADRGKDILGDAKTRATHTARQAQDAAVGYAKDEPVKAVLMAAAAGAALLRLATMMLRSDK